MEGASSSASLKVMFRARREGGCCGWGSAMETCSHQVAEQCLHMHRRCALHPPGGPYEVAGAGAGGLHPDDRSCTLTYLMVRGRAPPRCPETAPLQARASCVLLLKGLRKSACCPGGAQGPRPLVASPMLIRAEGRRRLRCCIPAASVGGKGAAPPPQTYDMTV